MNIEIVRQLGEHEGADRHKQRWEEVFEIVEVLVLAIAAIATYGAATRPPGATAPSRCWETNLAAPETADAGIAPIG